MKVIYQLKEVSRTVNYSLKLPLKANLCLSMVRFTAIDAKFAPPTICPDSKRMPFLFKKGARSYYKVSQKIFLVDLFLYRYMITVAGVERKHPWDVIPSA